MRIISGTARGLKLETLDGVMTRPTLDRVKEPLFSIIQTKIPGANVLDLFSGSGALGLEAVSRGAEKAVLCDSYYQAISIIKKNIEKARFQEKVMLVHCDYQKCIEILQKQKECFDIIFLDPPYKKNIAVNAINKILQNDLLKDDGIIIIETDELDRELKQLEVLPIHVINTRKYGRVQLIFLNRKGPK